MMSCPSFGVRSVFSPPFHGSGASGCVWGIPVLVRRFFPFAVINKVSSWYIMGCIGSWLTVGIKCQCRLSAGCWYLWWSPLSLGELPGKCGSGVGDCFPGGVGWEGRWLSQIGGRAITVDQSGARLVTAVGVWWVLIRWGLLIGQQGVGLYPTGTES